MGSGNKIGMATGVFLRHRRGCRWQCSFEASVLLVMRAFECKMMVVRARGWRDAPPADEQQPWSLLDCCGAAVAALVVLNVRLQWCRFCTRIEFKLRAAGKRARRLAPAAEEYLLRRLMDCCGAALAAAGSNCLRTAVSPIIHSRIELDVSAQGALGCERHHWR